MGSEEANTEGSEWEEEQEEQEEEKQSWEEGRVVWGLPFGRLLCANFPRLLNKSSYTNSVTGDIQHFVSILEKYRRSRKYTKPNYSFRLFFFALVFGAHGVED